LDCFFIAINLPVVGLAQTDNPEGFAALCEHDAIEPGIDHDIANFTQLAVILAVVGCAPYGRPLNRFGDSQRYAVLLFVGVALGLVVGRFYMVIVVTKTGCRNGFL
jgi:hypothetical protein